MMEFTASGGLELSFASKKDCVKIKRSIAMALAGVKTLR